MFPKYKKGGYKVVQDNHGNTLTLLWLSLLAAAYVDELLGDSDIMLQARDLHPAQLNQHQSW